MGVVSRVCSLQLIEGILGVARQRVAVESGVVGARAQREGRVGAVLGRGVLQWLAACHRSRGGQVVGVERREALAAVAALGDAEEVDAVGVDDIRDEGQTQQLLPGILLGLLPPAVVVTHVGNLRNEVDRGRILERLAERPARLPLGVLVARAVEVEEEGISGGRLVALRAPVVVHRGAGFERCGQQPASRALGAQRGKVDELLLVEVVVGALPGLPYQVGVAAHFGGVDGNLRGIVALVAGEAGRKVALDFLTGLLRNQTVVGSGADAGGRVAARVVRGAACAEYGKRCEEGKHAEKSCVFHDRRYC